MKLLYLLLSAPYLIVSGGLLLVSPKFRTLSSRTIRKIERLNHVLPDEYMYYTQIAEDHRGNFHFGVDQLAFGRVIISYVLKGTKQGASTIEQQLVRTITGNNEITLKRKIIEQLLATLVSMRFDKKAIVSSYIHIAYLGHNIRGVIQLAKHLDLDIIKDCESLAIELSVRLKYPEPSIESNSWLKKYHRRKKYIIALANKKPFLKQLWQLTIKIIT